MIACVGGGSNFSGFSFPLLAKKIKGKIDTDFVAAEPASVPSLTKGEYRYDFGDTAGMTPLLKMYTLGHEFIPSAIHAGGLRYHGMAPTVSLMKDLGYVRPVAVEQKATFEAGVMFANAEGVIPARRARTPSRRRSTWPGRPSARTRRRSSSSTCPARTAGHDGLRKVPQREDGLKPRGLRPPKKF